MIYELCIDDPKHTPVPHWHKVKFLKGQDRIEFKPGLNIIYGPNGSGKSTLLTGLAILMHCWHSNWPRVSKESIMDFFRPVGLCGGMVLEHDGSPARYLGVEPPGFPPEKGVEKVALSLKSSTDMRGKSTNNMSHGQATVSHLIRFLKAKPERVRYSFTRAKATAKWAPIYEVGIESIKNVRKQRGVPKQQVILLDEIDRSLDFAKQAGVWKQLRHLATDHQIIIASHSPFAVSVPGAHYIETTPHYLQNSRKALSLILDDIEEMEEAA
jgi:energy-coupling factor transporter ATP-binding protein EcfA2